MRSLKIFIFFLVILVLQTVVFSRLTYLGVAPDLFLTSVIILALREEDLNKILIFSAFAGFMQDLSSVGGYLNVVSKVIVGILTYEVREKYFGDKYTLAAGLVAIFTPILYFLSCHRAAFGYDWIAAIVYNLITVPVFWPIFEKIYRENGKSKA